MSSQHIHTKKRGQLPLKQHVLISGCYRSGTTFIEKLLHNHEHICIASQPFPSFYFQCKADFNYSIGIKRRYPLDHLFLETKYTESQFHDFLDRYMLNEEKLARLFEKMNNDKLGLWTPEIIYYWDRILPGYFIDVYRQLNGIVSQIFPKRDLSVVGTKEVLCEEYIPYILSKGCRAIIIIRDPRDVITSVSFRERDNLTGENRPVLFTLRAWRKSVAIALAYEDHPNFLWVRYEDLIEAPGETLERLTNFLQVRPFDPETFRKGIYDQHGKLWRGNSSFDDRMGISRESVGKFAQALSERVTSFVEACCWPEMNRLKYALSFSKTFDPSAIRSYREPYAVCHEKFDQDYSCREDHVREEIERIDKWRGTTGDIAREDARRWFIYERALKKLKEAA